MTTTIRPMSKEEVMELSEKSKVINRMSPELVATLEKEGWKFDDYSIEKVHKGLHLVIEFCIGDFCTSICSRKGHWLLEKKIPQETFEGAYLQQLVNIARINGGEHWTGEDN